MLISSQPASRAEALAAATPGAGRRPARILAISPSLQPSPALGPKLTGSSSQAASSAARSFASGSGSASSVETSSALGFAAASAVSARKIGLVGGLALTQALGQSRKDMRRLAEQFVGFGARPRREEFQKQRHEVRQFGRVDLDPAIFVKRLEIDHGLTAIPALAMHMLEQMQR